MKPFKHNYKISSKPPVFDDRFLPPVHMERRRKSGTGWIYFILIAVFFFFVLLGLAN